MRLRERVLPELRTGTSRRVPYLVAAAITLIAAATTVVLFTGSADNQPAHPHWTPPVTSASSAAEQRMVDACHVRPGDWHVGAYLERRNGDSVQLGVKDRGILGVCLTTNSHPTPSNWFTMVPWQPGHFWNTFQAAVNGGLVYGTIGPSVASVTVNGAPAVVANGTFVAEVDTAQTATVTTLDANGHVLDQGTVG